MHHVHRQFVPGGPQRGGGLALIHRDDIKIQPLDLHFRSTSFEFQSLVVISSTPSVLIVNIGGATVAASHIVY